MRKMKKRFYVWGVAVICLITSMTAYAGSNVGAANGYGILTGDSWLSGMRAYTKTTISKNEDNAKLVVTVSGMLGDVILDSNTGQSAYGATSLEWNTLYSNYVDGPDQLRVTHTVMGGSSYPYRYIYTYIPLE